jgi:tetratricopeptide (TPR) repeat protein
MKRALVAGILICFTWGICSAYPDDQRKQEIFINTDPIRAEVYIDGEKVGLTPLRIHGNEESYRVRIEKEGYDILKNQIRTSEKRRNHVFMALQPLNLKVVFTQKNQNVWINNRSVGNTPIEIKNLPAGSYQLEKNKEGISISNRGSRDQRRLVVLETLFSTGFFGLSITGKIYFDNHGDEKASQAMNTATFIFGGLLAYNLLKLQKVQRKVKQDLRDLTVIEVEEFRADSARSYFTSGMELVGREQWEDAIPKFNFVLNMFPDSSYNPITVFEIGYCYYQLEDYKKAVEYFRLFVHQYPIYELFPYGVFYLLDSELAGGMVQEAYTELGSLRPVYFDDESGQLFKDFSRIYVRLYEETGREDQTLIEELQDEIDLFLEAAEESSVYPEILLLKGKLLYKYLDREEGIRILSEVRKKYGYDKDLMKELEAVYNG